MPFLPVFGWWRRLTQSGKNSKRRAPHARARFRWYADLLRPVGMSLAEFLALPSTGRSSGRKRPAAGLRLEILEARVTPAMINWTGPAVGNWDVPGNWSGNAVPGAGDDAVISTAATVTIQSGDNLTVNSLTTASAATLSVTGGTLTIDGNSTLAGALTMTGGTLTANGSGVTVSETGTTSALNASFFATGGAVLSLPNLTTYNETSGSTFQATGSNSTLDVSGLANLGSMSNTWNVKAVSGGTVNLSGLSAINEANAGIQIVSDGAGSNLDLSAVTSIAGNSTFSVFTDTNGAVIHAPLLTAFNGENITLDGTGTIATAQWASLNGGGNLIVEGGSYSFVGLTNVDGSSLTAQSGGMFSLPNLISFTQTDGPTFLATGTGSTLDLSHLSTLGTMGNTWNVTATAGGTIDLSGLTVIDQANAGIRITSDGAGSEINLSALTGITSNPTFSTFTITHGAAIDAMLLTAFTGENITLDGSGPIATDQWASLNGGGNLIVKGGSYAFIGLTDVDGSSLTAQSGGMFSLPNLNSFTQTDGPTFTATGTGSTLDLSHLTTLGMMGNTWTVQAMAGGTIDLSGLTVIDQANAGIRITSDGAGSDLNLSGLTSITSNPTFSTFTITHSAAIDAMLLTAFTGENITLDGTGTIATDQWGSLKGGGNLIVKGGSYSFAGLTNVDGSSLTAQSGGMFSLPNLISFTQTDGPTFTATGTGSKLDLSALTTLPTMGNTWNVQALAGGTIDLSGLTVIDQPNAGIRIISDGPGSDLKLSALTSITGNPTFSSFTDTNSATIDAPLLTTFVGPTITLDGTGIIATNQWANLNGGGNLIVKGGSYSFPGLNNIDGSSLTAQSGGKLMMPSLTTYTETDGTTFEATGTGSVLDVSALMTLHDMSNGWEIESLSGGSVILSGLTTIDQPNAGVRIDSDGAGSNVNVSALTLYVANPTFSDVTVGNGGSITVPGATFTMPAPGARLTVNVPAVSVFPIILHGTGTYTGGITFNIAAGDTVTLADGTYNGVATFNLAAGATVTPSAATFGGGISLNVGVGAVYEFAGPEGATYTGLLTGSGAGTALLNSDTMQIGLGGATLNFAGNLFQWTGGALKTAFGDLTNLGTMNLAGPATKVISNDGMLDNFGTINQTGSGNLDLTSPFDAGEGAPPTTLTIEAGGAYFLNSDSGIQQDISVAGSAVINHGIIAKKAGTGTSPLFVDGTLTNTGTIEADSGALDLEPNTFAQIAGTTLTGGTWNANSGGTLQFPAGTSITSNAATIALNGPGASIVGIAGLSANSGSFTVGVGATFTTAGAFSNTGTLAVGGALSVNGALTLTSTSTFLEQIGGTTVGQFGQTTITTGKANLAGMLTAAAVNGFAIDLGESFPILSAPQGIVGSFATVSLPVGMLESASATGIVLNQPFTSSDLVASSVAAPGSSAAGQPVTITWTATNRSPYAASGTWQDSVYLSTTSTITANSILLGTVPHAGGLLSGGSYNGSLTVALPALSPGSYHVLVQVDSLYQTSDNDRANNTATAPGPLTVTVPMFTVGTPASGAFSAPNQDHYYQITVPSGGTMTVSLQSGAISGAVALYASLGVPPTPYDYQFAAASSNQASPTLLVPRTLAGGTYFILAHSVAGAAAAASYTLAVNQSTALGVTGISSYAGGNAGNVTIEIDGTNFTASTTATLTQGSTTINAGSVYFVNASQIFATFNLAGAALGLYTVGVQDGPNSATALTSFHVVAASMGQPLSLVLTPPASVRAGRDGVVSITVTNTGNNDIMAPLLQLTSDGATLKLPSQATFQGSTLYFLATSPTGPAGTLTPGESVQIQVQFESTTTGSTINFHLNPSDDTQPMDWASQEQALQIPTIPDAAWPIVFANFVANMGSTVASYHAVLAADATYLAQIGQPTNDVLLLVEFEIQKANAAYAAQTLVTVTPEDLPAPGMDLTFQQSYLQPISGRYYQGILGGQGWATNWDISALATSNGGVAVQISGSTFFFFLQSNGTYQPEAGSQGNVLSLSNGAYRLLQPGGTIYQFNTNGTLDFVQDANGNRITASYDGNGRLARLTDSNGAFLQLAYNAQGQMTTLTDSTGQTETYTYTGLFLTSYSDAFGTTTYSYVTGGTAAQNGSLDEIAYANNTHLFYSYNVQGQLIDQHRDGGAEDEQYNYLTPGGIVTTDANGNKATALFNTYGATAETIDALGNISTYQYDANLNLIQAQAPDGAIYSYAYDASGNLTRETDPLGNTTTYTYNINNNLTSYTDADGNTTLYGYDGNRNLLSVTYANGAEQQTTYNPLGEAVQYLNARGDAIAYQYNANGLISKETFADSTFYTFAYTPQGALASATDTNGNTTTFLYGNAGNPLLLTEVDFPDGTWLKFSYNIVGQRTQSVDQTGFIVNYTYDSMGRLQALTDGSNSAIVSYTYDAAGNLIQKDNGNGTRTVLTYDALNNVLSITSLAPDHVTVNSFDIYTYDALGNVLTDTNQDGEWVYTYDADSQLTHGVFTVNGTNPDGLTNQDVQYAYDAVGNRLSETVNGVTTTYLVNSVNEYTTSTTSGVTTNYGYDADGNLISSTTGANTTDYTFNDLNQLLGVSGPGSTATYAYNPLGQLVSQTLNGTMTNFQIDPTSGTTVAAFAGGGLYNNSGGLTAHFTSGFGLVSQVNSLGAAAYYDFDLAGDTIGITGSTGSYVNQYAYAPYGAVTTLAAALPNAFTFGGGFGVQDQGAGLFHMGARFYDAATGSFLSADPLGLNGGDPDLRRYASDSPINNADPLGLDSTNINPNNIFAVNARRQGLELKLQSLKSLQSSVDATKEFFPDLGDIVLGLVPAPAEKIAAAAGIAKLLCSAGRVAGGLGGAALSSVEGGLALTFANFFNGTPINDPGAGGGCPCQCPPGGGSPTCPTTSGPSGATPNKSSADPNALIGPAGFGTPAFVAGNAVLPYTVEFENDGTAAAQVVAVNQQLDANLDWSTFQLGSFGFGPVKVSIPAGLTAYQTVVRYQNVDGTPLNVLFNAIFNVQTGLLTATFTSLDPKTGVAPTGVLDGFLPPDDSTHVGEGFVQYTVQPKSVATGTKITQKAAVVFDTNAPLATNTTVNTVDAAAPSSSVATLPVAVGASFNVSWSGSDPAGGSGLATFNVYVSDNGGPFTLWQSKTKATSAVFSAQLGHTYAFYSVATDNAGNVQATPAAAQAVTFSNAATVTTGVLVTFVLTTSPTATVTPVALPAWLHFDGIATLSGTPDATTGMYPFNVTITDNALTTTEVLTLTVVDPPTINVPSIPTFQVGSKNSFKVTTNAGLPTATTLTESGKLPAGVTFTATGGSATIGGTPAPGTGGLYTFTVTAHNATGTSTQTFQLTINQPAAITSAASTTFVENQTGTFIVKVTGYPPPMLTLNASAPGWLHINPNGDGTWSLTGTPLVGSASATALSFKINATIGATTVSQTFKLTVDRAPTLTQTSGSLNLTVGTAITPVKVTASLGVPAAAVLSVSGKLPAGVVPTIIGNTLTLSGKPAAGSGGIYNITVTASNSAVSKTTLSLQLIVAQAPAITSAADAIFAEGRPGAFTIKATGFPIASIATRLLPSWLTFTDNGNGTATLTGTPPVGAARTTPYSFQITAMSGSTPTLPQTFHLTVDRPPTLTTHGSLSFTAGKPAIAFTATAVPGMPAATTLTESGTLPAGMSFTIAGLKGTLSGTPQASTGGTYNFTVTASSNAASKTVVTFTITVQQAPAITSAASAIFVVGQAGSFNVRASGFPAATFAETGALPGGVTLSSSGVLSGTPAAGSHNRYPIQITATNSAGTSVVQHFTLVVDTAPTFTGTTSGSNTFTLGKPGSFTIDTLAGVPATTTFAMSGKLPAGVTLSNNGRGGAVLSGTPLAGSAGVYNFSITASAGLAKTTQSFQLFVDQAPAITSALAATFMVGQANTFTIKTTGYPVAITASTLPAGIAFVDNGNGTATLSGIPQVGEAQVSPYPITLTATNTTTGVFVSKTFNLTIGQVAAITSAPQPSQSLTLGQSLTPFQVIATGLPAPTFALIGAPAGLTLVNTGNGTATVSGKPTVRGTFAIVITASVGGVVKSYQAFSLVVT
jgi:RHS repeat-associated protein